MEKEFIQYELAVKLKELGYPQNEYSNCFGRYRLRFDNILNSYYLDFGAYNPNKGNDVIAPLWQQAFDWFDRQCGLFVSFDKVDNTRKVYYYFTIIDSIHREYDDESMVDSAKSTVDWSEYETYEQARHACLEKLIELITTKD